jgi:hypothetical protein
MLGYIRKIKKIEKMMVDGGRLPASAQHALTTS